MKNKNIIILLICITLSYTGCAHLKEINYGNRDIPYLLLYESEEFRSEGKIQIILKLEDEKEKTTIDLNRNNWMINASSLYISLSPDRRYLFYAFADDWCAVPCGIIKIVSLDGKLKKNLDRIGGWDFWYILQPNSKMFINKGTKLVKWLPDGKKLAYYTGHEVKEYVLGSYEANWENLPFNSWFQDKDKDIAKNVDYFVEEVKTQIRVKIAPDKFLNIKFIPFKL